MCIGNSAGINMTSNANGNTLIGVNAGIQVGSSSIDNTCLGYGAGIFSNANLNNTTRIGYHASANYNNQMVFGSGIETMYIAGAFMIQNSTINPWTSWSISNYQIGGTIT